MTYSLACWYIPFASLNSFSELEMLLSLRSIMPGIFFKIDGGWLEHLFTYVVELFGFLKGHASGLSQPYHVVRCYSSSNELQNRAKCNVILETTFRKFSVLTVIRHPKH
eukprot:sb/3477347/